MIDRMQDKKNWWDEFEYDKLKLLCHNDKVKSLMEVYEGIKLYDNIPPISVEMHLTNNCNLCCPWCTDANLHCVKATLKTDTVISLMREFAQMKTGVTLEGGGEPTIHPDFQDIVRFGHDNNVSMGLITNGTVDISPVLNMFKWVRISLDSSNKDEYLIEKGKDFFDKVMDNLEKYKDLRDEKKCFLGIGYVLTKRNCSDIAEIISRLDDLGVDYIYFRPVEEAPDITPDRDELYDLRKRILALTDGRRIKFKMVINDRLVEDNAGLPCVAHSLTSIIHADGSVACCEKRRHDYISIGNVYVNSFSDIWKSEDKINATKKLLEACNQKGCGVCRITSFNKIIDNLESLNTRYFI